MTAPWPDNYSEQADYVNDLEQRLKVLHLKSVPASYVGTTRPTTAQLANAWSLKEGKTLSVPPYAKTQWYNPATDTIENLYTSFPLLSADPLGIQTDEIALPTTEIIDRFVVQQGDAGATTFTASWTKVYRLISFYYSVRSTAAATSTTFRIRPNADGTAVYAHAASKNDQTPQLTFDTSRAVATGLGNSPSVPAATAANAHIFGQGFGQLYFPDVTTLAKSGFMDNIWLVNDASGITDFRYLINGIHWNNLAAMTSLAFSLVAGNFAVGSKIVVFGHHPTS